MATYEIEAQRFSTPLPKITLTSSAGLTGVIQQYERRYGTPTEIKVTVVDDGEATRRQLGESA